MTMIYDIGIYWDGPLCNASFLFFLSLSLSRAFSRSLHRRREPKPAEKIEKTHSTVLFLANCLPYSNNLKYIYSDLSQIAFFCIGNLETVPTALLTTLSSSSPSSPSDSLELFTLLALQGLRPGTSSVGPGRELQSTQRAKCYCNNEQT